MGRVMLDREHTENWHTVYDQAGLRAEYLDNDAVALYCENIHRITMTLAEWNNINMALEGVKNEQV